MPAGERPVEVTKAQAAAAVNRVAVAVADRCGTERGQAWFGASLICGPDGYLRAGPAAGEQALLVADVDLARMPGQARRPVQRRVSRPATGAVRRALRPAELSEVGNATALPTSDNSAV